MTRRLISSGSPFEEVMGYSRAVVDGDWVFVSGTTGFKDGQIAEDVVVQAETALGTIEAALKEAGAGLADVVRVVCYLTDAADFPNVAKVLGSRFRPIKPANSTVIVSALVDPRMKVEVEVTALKRR
jgi:enamine deaminase RidA (YjgF/YER057c/UK114 family)